MRAVCSAAAFVTSSVVALRRSRSERYIVGRVVSSIHGVPTAPSIATRLRHERRIRRRSIVTVYCDVRSDRDRAIVKIRTRARSATTSVRPDRCAGSEQDGGRIKSRAPFDSRRIMVVGVGGGDDDDDDDDQQTPRATTPEMLSR